MSGLSERDVERLAAIIRPWTLCDDGGGFDHGSERAARRVLTSGWLAKRDAAIRAEAKAEALAPIRALADEWQRVADERLPHDGCFRMYDHHAGILRALLDGGDQCSCGAPDTTSLNPAEVVVHRTDGPCYIGASDGGDQ